MMLLAFDSYYYADKAKTVCFIFDEWTSVEPKDVIIEITNSEAGYQSGEFYKRELPCILNALKRVDLNDIDAIIIDGFVVLDDFGKLGLGGHLYEERNRSIPVIGIAKNDYKSLIDNKRAELRGKSTKPLYITALGINIDEAAAYVKMMSGEYRIPTLLKQLDILTKQDLTIK
ncbi:endonuclease V [Mucilaginibacter sp.]|uniref:endonuclease V n=1 Tax=Mucilaginibacter sp. TaxID=1882438 RepID=UPI0032663C8A